MCTSELIDACCNCNFSSQFLPTGELVLLRTVFFCEIHYKIVSVSVTNDDPSVVFSLFSLLRVCINIALIEAFTVCSFYGCLQCIFPFITFSLLKPA